MSREAHVRFWEGVGVRFPGATRLPARLRNANRAPSRVSPVLRVLQRQAPPQRTGPTHPGCGVLWPGRPRIGSLKQKEDFTSMMCRLALLVGALAFSTPSSYTQKGR